MRPASALPGPAYRIHTSRLVIRCWHPADAPLLKTAIDDSLDHLRPWLPWTQHEPEDVQAKVQLLRTFRGQFDLGQDFYYGIFNRNETRVLGGTGLHRRLGEGAREIGYWIHTAHINQGLATEVSAALTKVAFEVERIRRVEIHCDPTNVRSAAVPRKLGYVHDATLRQRLLLAAGQYRDVMVWSLLAAEYPGSPAATATLEAFDAASFPLF